MGVGTVVAGKEMGLTNEAHGSARGGAQTSGSALTGWTQRAEREHAGAHAG